MRSKLFGSTILLGDEFLDDFKKLLSLSPEQIKEIGRLTDTEKGFDVSGEDLEEMNEVVKIDEKILSGIIPVSKYIYEKAREKTLSSNDVLSDLQMIAKKISIEIPKTQEEALRSLFERKKEYHRRERVDNYRRGIIPRLYSISLVCDWRAVFDENTNEFLEWIPVVIGRFRTVSDVDEKKEMTLQFDEESLAELREAIEEVLGQLSKVRERFPGERSEKGKKGGSNG